MTLVDRNPIAELSSVRASQALDGVWIVNKAGHTLYANQRMAEILRTSRLEMLGHLSLIYVAPKAARIPEPDVSSSQTDWGHDTVRVRLLRADSTAIWVEVKESPMLSPLGEVVGTIGVFRVVERVNTATGAYACQGA